VNCKEILNILSDYVDGELAEEQCCRIREHLKDCSACREFAETFRRSLEIAHDLDEKHVPEDVCERVLQAFRSSCGQKDN